MEEMVSSSAVVEHVATCPCPDDQITITRIHHKPFFRVRKVKETLYIRHRPCINGDEGVGISGAWAVVAVVTDCATMR
ncbi:hypothetical protein M514_09366 [Trichuris suis]|uniref:Uncharacterized protein n=1 Tax=Trichuris suis TaxID=68888 RepID=A0A085LXS5_9BILA|nr:hypothetical protein M513_09366 [Trichuris suis]KFD68516.1 hypothetical protein M514_09366 [Trichuris suis]